MLIAPVIGAIFPFAYYYAVKLFIDLMSVEHSISYSDIIFLLLFYPFPSDYGSFMEDKQYFRMDCRASSEKITIVEVPMIMYNIILIVFPEQLHRCHKQ